MVCAPNDRSNLVVVHFVGTSQSLQRIGCFCASSGGFDGCFIDSAGVANDAGQAAYAQRCNTSTALMAELGKGTTMLLDDLQTAVGPTKLIIAKDDFSGGSEASVNSIMPMDTFCSCYNCDPNTWSTKVFREGMTYAGICQTQIQESIKRGKRGQVSVLHGEVNAWLGVNRTALENDFTFTLASFLIAASDSSFFGYSKGWYYNGTTWHAAVRMRTRRVPPPRHLSLVAYN